MTKRVDVDGRINHTVREWTEEEDDMLREFYKRGAVADLVELLGRTPSAVSARWRVINTGARDRTHEITRNAESRIQANAEREPWTPEDDQTVRDTMGDPIADVASLLGRSIFSIQVRRFRIRRGDPLPYVDLGPQHDSVPARLAPIKPNEKLCLRCTGYHPGEC